MQQKMAREVKLREANLGLNSTLNYYYFSMLEILGEAT